MSDETKHTGLLLLQRQLVPVGLHAVPQRHPQLGLLLRRHRLPPLLDPGQGRVRDGVRVRVPALLLPRLQLLLLPARVLTGGRDGQEGLQRASGGGRGQERGRAAARSSRQRA